MMDKREQIEDENIEIPDDIEVVDRNLENAASGMPPHEYQSNNIKMKNGTSKPNVENKYLGYSRRIRKKLESYDQAINNFQSISTENLDKNHIHKLEEKLKNLETRKNIVMIDSNYSYTRARLESSRPIKVAKGIFGTIKKFGQWVYQKIKNAKVDEQNKNYDSIQKPKDMNNSSEKVSNVDINSISADEISKMVNEGLNNTEQKGERSSQDLNSSDTSSLYSLKGAEIIQDDLSIPDPQETFQYSNVFSESNDLEAYQDEMVNQIIDDVVSPSQFEEKVDEKDLDEENNENSYSSSENNYNESISENKEMDDSEEKYIPVVVAEQNEEDRYTLESSEMAKLANQAIENTNDTETLEQMRNAILNAYKRNQELKESREQAMANVNAAQQEANSIMNILKQEKENMQHSLSEMLEQNASMESNIQQLESEQAIYTGQKENAELELQQLKELNEMIFGIENKQDIIPNSTNDLKQESIISELKSMSNDSYDNISKIGYNVGAKDNSSGSVKKG